MRNAAIARLMNRHQMTRVSGTGTAPGGGGGGGGAPGVMPADEFLGYIGYNVKASYAGTGNTYAGSAANIADTIAIAQDMRLRVYRESPATGGNSASRQKQFVTEVNPVTGMQWHVTFGSLRNQGGDNVPAMNFATCKTFASSSTLSQMEYLIDNYYTLVGNGTTAVKTSGDWAELFHSFAGPNEIEAIDEVGYNWPRNARLFQEALWKLAREGKTWNGSAWVTVHNEYISMFANVPIAGPSTRTDLNKTNTWTIFANGESAGARVASWWSVVDGAVDGTGAAVNTPSPNLPAYTAPDTLLSDGTYSMNSFVEVGNPHMYNGGNGDPGVEREAMAQAYSPICRTGIAAPMIFSESGYTHMGFDPVTGAWNGPPDFVGSHAGQRRTPPWAIANYAVRGWAEYAMKGYTRIVHEFKDDTDLPTNNRSWDQEFYFGLKAYPGDDTPSNGILLPEYYANLRLSNLLYDRGNSPKVKPTYNLSPVLFTVTNDGGDGTLLDPLVVQKTNGRSYILLWRGLKVYQPNTSINPANAGNEITHTNKTVTLRFDHASGTKTVKRWRPNKATSSSVSGQPSVDWDPIPATSDQDYGNIAAGGTINITMGTDLEIIEVY